MSRMYMHRYITMLDYYFGRELRDSRWRATGMTFNSDQLSLAKKWARNAEKFPRAIFVHNGSRVYRHDPILNNSTEWIAPNEVV